MKIDTSARFLVIDSSKQRAGIIIMALKKMGFEYVEMAANGADAMYFLTENPTDAVICEWDVAGLSGIDLLRHVRSHTELSHIRFLLMTAEKSLERASIAIEEKVTEFLVRPFNKVSFVDKIERLLRHPGHHDRQAEAHKEPNKPLPPRGSEPPAIQVDAVAIERKHTILVVDDVASNIDVITGILKEQYKVKVALNGAKALKIAMSDSPPDLILLDVMMPEMDGLEVCTHLKQNPDTEAIPVIFLTAKTEVKDITKGFEVGAVDYATKPVNAAVLKARIKTHLQLKQTVEDGREQVDSLLQISRLREEMERITQQELREPASKIVQLSQQLLEIDWLTAEQKKVLHTIGDEAWKITSSINLSIDLYKMETDAYKVAPVPLNIVSLLQKLLNEYRRIALPRKVKLLFDGIDKCEILGEEQLCIIILRNLLANAVEASPNSTVINVNCSEDDTAFILTISNQGEVDDSITDTLFDKFVSYGKGQALGLGAYSARLMAQVQGGSLRLLSSDASGTRICLRLPTVK